METKTSKGKEIKIPGPDHPITISPAEGKVRVMVAGRIVAESAQALRRDEKGYAPVYYLPRNDADMSLLVRTAHYTYCPYKGDCTYYSIPIGGSKSEYALWTYEKPYEAVASIKEYLAFYPSRIDAIEMISQARKMYAGTKTSLDGQAPVTVHNQGGPCIELEHSLPSEVAAISPFVDKLMRLIRKCGCADEGESDVEVALREALANAIIHGNHENPGKHVHVRCRCERSEISIAVKDEGRGFDVDTIADPTAPENQGSIHGRGIYLMKALMDEVRFEEAGVVVHMRKSTGKAGADDVKKHSLE